MAASSDIRKRKRGMETLEASECRGKLLLGENVEVLQLGEGVKGSWNAGVVVGLAENSRLVEYCDILTDDGETKLVEAISVSAALEGLPRGAPNNCRRRIRPLPYRSHVHATEVTYGLCMDAFVDDAWWEGVVFDHEEGAETRLIFFPDIGNQEMVAATRLRVTRDWNEVSGKWKPRGRWLLLQELHKFEQEDGLPVSTKEIWYDLRTMPSFRTNIGLWMAGSPPMWHALLSQLFHEFYFVFHGQPTAAEVAENPLVTELMILDDTDISARDTVHLADSLFENEAGAAVQTVLDLEVDEVQCAELPVYADCPSGYGDNEVVKFANFAMAAELPYVRDNSDPQSDSLPHPLSEYVAEYLRTGSSRGSHLRSGLKNLYQKAESYLLTTGWQYKKNKYGSKYYVSPDGMTYKSLILSCQSWKNKELQMMPYDGFINSLSCSNMSIDTESTILQANNNPDNMARGVGRSWQPLCLQPEFCPEAITFYASRLENKNPRRKKLVLSEKVKKHLLALGWSIEFKRDGHSRIRCFSPQGKVYYSLYKACSDLLQGCSGELEGLNVALLHSTPSSNKILDNDYRCYIGHKVENSPQRLNNLGNLDDNYSLHKFDKNRNSLLMSSHPNIYFSGKLLSALFDKGIILPGQVVSYKKDGMVITEGCLTRKGIKCNCCDKLYSPVSFVIHASSNRCKQIENIFLGDGRSLLQCQMQMAQSESPVVFSHPRLKTLYNLCQSDTVCSFCRYGGKLILCDHCPSAFHPHCIGLEDIPKGNWFCPSCCCSICGFSEFNNDVEHLTKQTIVFCDQCERSYHIGCKSKNGTNRLQFSPNTDGFCGKTCSKIFFRLRKLLGIPKLTSKGLSWTVLRYTRETDAEYEKFDLETLSCHRKKLNVALGLLHECFTTIIEDRTKSDLFADILFNKESDLNRLNFWGFYTMLLERGDEVISVATFRVFGKKMAEMPLVCTHPRYRGQGMCHLILHELEKLLSSLGVERLCIPAVTQLLSTWTSSFGFAEMSSSERTNVLDYTFLNFPDTTMCHKLLRAAQETKMDPIGNGSPGNSETFDPDTDNHVEKVELDNASQCLDSGVFYFPAQPGASNEIDYQSYIASSPANGSSSCVKQRGIRGKAIEVASSRPEDSKASTKISRPVVALCALLDRTVDNLNCKLL